MEHWSHTAFRPKLFFFDCLLATPIPFILMRFTSLTLWALFILMLIFFFILNKFGYSVHNFFRLLHYISIGKRARGKPKYMLNGRF